MFDASAPYWSTIDDLHRGFVERLVERLPADGRVLDAACGPGRYFGLVLERGRSVVGVDHSGPHLAMAAERHPDVPTVQTDLQDLPFDDGFDGLLCIDAMEFVPPEDWSLVLERFRRALRRGGWLYLTIELVAEEALRGGHEAARRLGLPVVEGEAVWDLPDWYYHYYPGVERARAWLADAGFSIEDEVEGPWDEGYAYHHVLARLGRVAA